MKKLTPREIKIKNKPWLNEEIAKLIKLRNKAHARKKRQPNNVNCKRFYNLLRNRVHREIKKSKKQYYADYFADNVNNIKKTWEGIRKIANIRKMSMKTTQLNIGGRVIDDETVIAKAFNNYFANVGPNTENTIPKVSNISPLKFLKDCIPFNFIIAHNSNEEIPDMINALEDKST